MGEGGTPPPPHTHTHPPHARSLWPHFDKSWLHHCHSTGIAIRGTRTHALHPVIDRRVLKN